MPPAPQRTMMTKTVRNTLHSIGDRSGDVARTIGSGTADLAKRFGRGTADVASRIGPKRALIGLAVLTVAIGGSVMLVRYLRARADGEFETGSSGMSRGAKSRNRAYPQSNADSRASI
jgi:hypothetical protein